MSITGRDAANPSVPSRWPSTAVAIAGRDETAHQVRISLGRERGQIHAVRDREDGDRAADLARQGDEVAGVGLEVERAVLARAPASARMPGHHAVVACKVRDHALVHLGRRHVAEVQDHDRSFPAHLVMDARSVGARQLH